MGTFYIAEPKSQDQYTAYYKDEFNGIEYTKSLPNVLATGIGMQVQNLGTQVSITIKRNLNVTDDLKNVKLYGIINSQIVYKANIKLFNKTTQTLEIITDSFPTGVMQLTLFNSNYQPLVERIVFINNNNYSFFPSIKLASKNVTKRAKNVIEISVSDTLLSNMSVAITDANTPSDTATNIFSQLLLTGDIKGYVLIPPTTLLKMTKQQGNT